MGTICIIFDILTFYFSDHTLLPVFRSTHYRLYWFLKCRAVGLVHPETFIMNAVTRNLFSSFYSSDAPERDFFSVFQHHSFSSLPFTETKERIKTTMWTQTETDVLVVRCTCNYSTVEKRSQMWNTNALNLGLLHHGCWQTPELEADSATFTYSSMVWAFFFDRKW